MIVKMDGSRRPFNGADDNKYTAVLWINGEIRPLPLLNKGSEANASGVSADGSIIVGKSHHSIDKRSIAIRWAKDGVESIGALLEKSGVDLQGAHLKNAKLLSANGRLVIEKIEGRNDCYYRAVLPSKYSR